MPQFHSFTANIYFARATTTHAPDVNAPGRRVLKSMINVAIPDGVALSADISGHFSSSSPTAPTPAAVVKMLFAYWGLPQYFDAAAFTTAHAEHTARGYRFDGVIQDPGTRKALLLKLTAESDSLFDWPVDKALIRVQPEAPGAAVDTLGVLDVVSEDKRRSLTVTRSDPRDTYNVIAVRYRRSNSQAGAGVATNDTGQSLLGPLADTRHGSLTTSYQRFYAIQNRESVRIYGPRSKTYALDFVRSPEMARRLAQVILTRSAFPTELVQITTKRVHLAVEKNDQLELNPL